MMNIYAVTVSDLNPIHDIGAAASASASAIGSAVWHAVSGGLTTAIVDGISTLLKAVITLITYEIMHTTPQFANTKFNRVQPAIFSPVWHVMVMVGIACAMFILVVGVVSSILKGETGTMLKQLVFGLIAVLAMASPIPPIMAQAIFSLIDVFSKYIMTAALTLAGTTAKAGSASVIATLVHVLTVTTPGTPMIFVIVISIVAVLAAIAVWFELIARVAIAYLIMGLFPLALAGMFYKGSARWVRRAVEGLLAVAIGQIIIVILFAFAISSLLASAVNVSMTDIGLFAMFMFLASMGLPIAMKVAPMAFEMGEAAFHASSLAGTARGAVASHTTQPAKSALMQRLHAPVTGKIMSAGKGGSSTGSTGAAASTKSNAWNSMTEKVAGIGEIAADRQSKPKGNSTNNPHPAQSNGVKPTGTNGPSTPKTSPTTSPTTRKRTGGTPSNPTEGPSATPAPFVPKQNPKRFNRPRDTK